MAQLSPDKFDCQICPATLPLLGDILAINPYKASPVLLSSLHLVTVSDGLKPLPAACTRLEQRILETVGARMEGKCSSWERSASVRGDLSAGAGR